MSRAHEEAFWGRELEAFQNFLAEAPGRTYRDWQPTKWQSLERICSTLVGTFGGGCTALELGCGSATLLLQLAKAGWCCTGIDIARSAINLASLAAQSIGVSPDRVHFVISDFNNWSGPGADLVLSIGVIEHVDEERQLHLLDLHCRHAGRAVLIGVPNLESPVYQSFVEWARRNDCLYEEKHFPTSIPNLAKKLGRRVLVEDGCHLFLSKGEYFIAGDAELADFYGLLRTRLMRVGGMRFSCFPRMDLAPADIDVLSQVEAEASLAERLRFGFLHYYVLQAPV